MLALFVLAFLAQPSRSTSLAQVQPTTSSIKYLIVGGKITDEYGQDGLIKDVEKIDLTKGAHSNCVKPPDYPTEVHGFDANSVHGGSSVVACGGLNDYGFLHSCQEFDPTKNSWEFFANMTKRRSLMSSISRPSGDIWLIGGATWDFWHAGQTLDILKVDDHQAVAGPDLPVGLMYHCAVSINQTHVFIGSGNFIDNGGFNQAWMINTEYKTFDRVADMKYPRSGAGCGLVKTRDGSKGIIMAGGLMDDSSKSPTTSEIYLLNSGEWIEGPALPRNYQVGGHANPDDSTLVLAGGLEMDGKGRDDILVLDSSQTQFLEELKFTTSEAKLKTPRYLFAMVAVRDEDKC